jgi:hypothetical protein
MVPLRSRETLRWRAEPHRHVIVHSKGAEGHRNRGNNDEVARRAQAQNGARRGTVEVATIKRLRGGSSAPSSTRDSRSDARILFSMLRLLRVACVLEGW